jgi:hypothetical protein
MSSQATLNKVLTNLENYLEENQYVGYDPYDGLNSKLFRLPIFKSNKFIRFSFQQLIKRFPVDMRLFFGIEKKIVPTTLGNILQAYAYLYEIEKNENKKAFFVEKMEKLIELIESYASKGYSGACWGYSFDWQARRATINAFQPNIVSTGMITNGLYECWRVTQNEKCKTLILSSSNFVLNDINKTWEGDSFCYSYSPFDRQKVLNASMKAVRILAQAYSINSDVNLINEAEKAVKYTVSKQFPDGSFHYSDVGKWVDNYHTGYVLDCLDSFIVISGKQEYLKYLERGLQYFEKELFNKNGFPKFYANNMYPLDCTASSQAIMTLSRFGNQNLAEKVAQLTIEKMFNDKGYFYFRKFKYYTIKTSFMRWSNAPMFLALSYLKYSKNNTNL